MAVAGLNHGNGMATAELKHGNVMATGRLKHGHDMASARLKHGNDMAMGPAIARSLLSLPCFSIAVAMSVPCFSPAIAMSMLAAHSLASPRRRSAREVTSRVKFQNELPRICDARLNLHTTAVLRGLTSGYPPAGLGVVARAN